MEPRHPNIAQVFGICRSPDFPAIVLHSNAHYNLFDIFKLMPVWRYYTSLSQKLLQVLDCNSVAAILLSIGT